MKPLARTWKIRRPFLCHWLKFSLLLLVLESAVRSEDAFGPGASEPKTPKEQYGEGVRLTGPLTPQDELAGFHLPPGFVVELVASEPEINKPLNMAFDTRGRLWVTNTIEYPYPAPDNRKPRDSIRIIEDIDRDGYFEKVTMFADGLNIPIGVLPISDGAIAFSIPNLIHLIDTDGDGICDERKVILGPFDTTRDTHGMVNSLRMGIDGWVYACHGFNNQSKVTATDGSEVSLNSGNTFRFRSDGSHIEHFSFGQVNPFGMCADRWGNWFTADCHSKPITQLLRGGYFSSFGRSDDGLGFVPSMMEHSHGSTAICGIELFDAESFPTSYRHQFYSGNVMTSRINRNALEEQGATLRAIELQDFLTSDDPWFRPVDIQLGPDGGLYVADFYNKIIGHYEVPLTHPERDRDRGRIWRITYRGEDRIEATKSLSLPSTSNFDDFQLLRDSNATVRRLARERIRLCDDSIVLDPLREGLQNDDPILRIECCWELTRRGKLTNRQRLALLRDKNPMVRAHAVRAIAETSDWSRKIRLAVRERLQDSDARVVRFAVEAIGKNAESSDVTLLLGQLNSVPAKDTILRQAIRIAVRDALSVDSIASEFDAVSVLQSGDSAKNLAEILLGLHSEPSANWLMSYLEDEARSLPSILKTVTHVASNISDEEFPRLVDLLRRRNTDFRAEQKTFLLIQDAIKKGSETTKKSLAVWGEALSKRWHQQFNDLLTSHTEPFVDWFSGDEEGWPDQMRSAKDGIDDGLYRSSFPRGEKYKGTLSSGSFSAPERLSFWLVGHDGDPKRPAARKNSVRLIDDQTQKVIREAFPPRSDVAVQTEWDLREWKDRNVHFECRDQNDGRAYAWIGIGRFDFPPLQSNEVEQNLQNGLMIVRAVRPSRLAEPLFELSKSTRFDAKIRCEIIETWATLRGNVALSQLALAIRSFPMAQDTLPSLLDAMTAESTDRIGAELLKKIVANRPFPEQRNLARLLAKQRASLPWLLRGIQEGWISTSVLRDSAVMQGIDSLADPADKASAAAMLASLPSIDPKVEELAKRIVIDMETNSGDSSQGGLLFQKHCTNCHQLGGLGTTVGPQLDGAIARSSARLLEDILFPDRNVDHAFRTTSLLVDDSLVRVGLIRNETTEFVELVENTGQVVRIAVDSISERKLSTGSLMPSGLHELIGEDGLVDLLAYLFSKRNSTSTPK